MSIFNRPSKFRKQQSSDSVNLGDPKNVKNLGKAGKWASFSPTLGSSNHPDDPGDQEDVLDYGECRIGRFGRIRTRPSP